LNLSDTDKKGQNGVPTQEEFYCLLIHNDPIFKKSPWYLGSGGECDIVTGNLFYMKYRDPYAKITPVQFVNGSGERITGYWIVTVSMLFYVIYNALLL
jgi:hypothetical protein